ncbi:DUF1351 domain-containing protein [Capnocytophaga ochracea]|uniref:Protein of uncharacterized function (DUF1351) n=1 Tax=Capnocytophaga ochracea TaxID=1018 RepID=A0A2X2SH04_CAPOC|nr:DUF1351 domain-containing protein [Capnocytophaga ochracea]SQA92442.1 Protein of uncharacterised function (DUF1351) [Capnocytophaga ochracea]SQA92517.1 Protein of uncharacterised function (DUF1351) [Capnocytophaga ochracea]
MNEQLITLKQAPIIVYEKIKAVGQQIEAKIAELNLDNQLVTDETLKSAKETRAMLHKELDVFETQRKFIKEQVNAPYEAFEKAYKEHIKVHYEKADSTLKSKIDEVQNRLISDKITRIKDYFTELCQSQGIDFLIFERLPLNITLSASDKSLKEQVANFVGEVSKSLQLIESLSDPDEFKAEILTEYKQTLDITRAIQGAQYRRQQREAELQRIEAQRATAEQARLAAEERARETAPLQAPAQVQPEQEATQAPLQEEILQYTLTVQGTRAQLKALRAFLETNNIKYTAE